MSWASDSDSGPSFRSRSRGRSLSGHRWMPVLTVVGFTCAFLNDRQRQYSDVRDDWNCHSGDVFGNF
jgi:hypothetical protein